MAKKRVIAKKRRLVRPDPTMNLRERDCLAADASRSAFTQVFIVLSLSIAVYCIVAAIITRWYHPDLSQALQIAREKLTDATSGAPKPMERLLYSIAVLLMPVCVFVFSEIFRRCLAHFSPKDIRVLYIGAMTGGACALLLITYAGLSAPNPCAGAPQNAHDNDAKTNLDFYFISSFVYNHFAWYCCLLFPAVLAYFLYSEKLPTRCSSWMKKAEAVISYGGGAAIAIALLFIAAFKFPYTFENKYDFNAVYYSVVQVYNGLPMLVNHFTNTYGLYPHFVVPIMKLFGPDILSFTAIMAALLCLCFVFLLLFLGKIIKHKFLILLSITTVFYNCYIYAKVLMPFDAYYAMAPIRWILPFSLLFFAVCYLNRRSKLLYYSSFFFYGLGILWSPDFGLVTFFSLVAFYSFLEFENVHLTMIVKRIALHAVAAGLGLAAAFAVFSVSIRIFYGAFPDLGLLFSTLKIFSIVGMGMLPTPSTMHPWMLVALIYLIGIAVSVRSIITRSVSPLSSLVFLLTAIGIIAFQYYLGRSHNWNLFCCSPWCFILLTIFADEALTIFKKQGVFFLPVAGLLFVLSFSLFQVTNDYKKIISLMFEREAKEKNKSEQEFILRNVDFIHSITREKETVMIFSINYFQGLYYGLSHTAAAINPGFEDLFLRTDYERILSYIVENKRTKVFFDAATFRFFDQRIPVLLASLYDVRNSGGSILYLVKKKEDEKGELIFRPDSNSVLHEILDKNLSNEALAAEGKQGPIKLGHRFSVQVLFKPAAIPATIYTTWQTVFSNRQENDGFALMEKNDDQAHYLFTIAGVQIDCPVDIDKWNYLSFEMNGNLLRVFKNGRIFGTIDTRANYQNSGLPLFIGNYNMQGGFFWGDIKELKISNSLLDEKEVLATWERATLNR
jgi:hypothetical protein